MLIFLYWIPMMFIFLFWGMPPLCYFVTLIFISCAISIASIVVICTISAPRNCLSAPRNCLSPLPSVCYTYGDVSDKFRSSRAADKYIDRWSGEPSKICLMVICMTYPPCPGVLSTQEKAWVLINVTDHIYNDYRSRSRYSNKERMHYINCIKHLLN